MSVQPRLKVVDTNGKERYADTGMPVNHVWDACVEVLGYEPKTVTEKRMWGNMTNSLRLAGANRERIVAVAQYYRKHWPDVDLTLTALEKWYSHFLRMKEQKEKMVKNVCPDCGCSSTVGHAADCSHAASS